MQYMLQERMEGGKYLDLTTNAGHVGLCVDQWYVTVTDMIK